MEMPIDSPFLNAERKSTDESLIAERDKTNRTLERAHAASEHKTDSAVTEDRRRIDRAVTSDRRTADTKLDVDRHSPAYHANEEQRLGDERLREERARSDHALNLERTRTDGAVTRERVLNSRIAGRVLARERQLTDQNLSVERRQTDSHVDHSSQLLSREVADHLRTKVSLTTRDEFIAIVSHDLRNPIGAASSTLAMLVEDAAEHALDAEVKHWLEFAKRNVDVSLRLIADLLDLEQIARGKLEMRVGDHDADAIATEAINTFVHAPSGKRLTLRALPSPTPIAARCDRDRVLQILSNLINNALKFTGDGGSITIAAHPHGRDVQFSVADSGVGIPSERIAGIFDRFTQLKSKDRRGLGLGLYICKMFVEAHGGRIWVDSAVGHGSTFSFTIPRTRT